MRLKALIVVAVWACAGSAPALVINGDFSDGLNGWSYTGDVQDVGGAAGLGDDVASYSLLYQGVALPPGRYTIAFDFLNLLSADVPLGFPDTVFASLYFIDDFSQFDLDGAVFDDAIALFDLDYNGPFNNYGFVDTSPLGPEWSHFTMTFDSAYAYAIPVFELIDLNFVEGDSALHVDNVAIQVVPEPATVLILGSGLVLYAARARRRRSKTRKEAPPQGRR